MISALILFTPLFAQAPIDGTNTGAPIQGPGQAALSAPVSTKHGLSTSVTLTATDSKTMASVSSQNWNDNRFRAYWSSTSQGFVDGFVKFDLSTIPDSATITGLTLRAYHEEGFGNPNADPEVMVYRVGTDSWSRSATNSHPGLDEALTGIYTGFPSADLVPVDFVLDVNAANWLDDLSDDTLSLALRNEAGNVGRYSYVYFYGSDASPAPPELIVTYLDGPTLTLSNLVAGSQAIVEIASAPANALCYAGWSRSAGSTAVNTPWGKFTTGLGMPLSQLPPFQANGSGSALLQVNVPPSAVGVTVYVQALVVSGGSAELTNVDSGTVI